MTYDKPPLNTLLQLLVPFTNISFHNLDFWFILDRPIKEFWKIKIDFSFKTNTIQNTYFKSSHSKASWSFCLFTILNFLFIFFKGLFRDHNNKQK